MTAICKDNNYTWRNVLTIDKEYEILDIHNDEYAGYSMINIICDDGKERIYRANRFKIINTN